jgi:hypothetical protein
MTSRHRRVNRAHLAERPTPDRVNWLGIVLRTRVTRSGGARRVTFVSRTLRLSERDNGEHHPQKAQREAGECAGIKEGGMGRAFSFQKRSELLCENFGRTDGTCCLTKG